LTPHHALCKIPPMKLSATQPPSEADLRRLREEFERQYKVKFKDRQWEYVQARLSNRTAEDKQLVEILARFLSLGRRKRTTTAGKPRGPYLRPMVKRFALVAHVDLCRGIAARLGIRGREFWDAFAEAHELQMGVKDRPTEEKRLRDVERLYYLGKKDFSRVPLRLRGWDRTYERLRAFGVTDEKALAKAQEDARKAKIYHLPPGWGRKWTAKLKRSRQNRPLARGL